jgi:hypothetical protein
MVLAHQGTWRQSVSLDPNHTSSSLANFSLSHLPISLRSNRYPPHPTLFRNIMRPSIALFLAGICTVAGAVSTNLPAAVHKFPCHLTNETLHPLPICSDIVLANGTLPLDMLCIEHVKNIENSEIVSTPSGCTNPLFDQNTSAQQDNNAADFSDPASDEIQSAMCVESVGNVTSIKPRNIKRSLVPIQPSDVERSPVYTTEVNTMQWCYREGPRPQRDDVEKLCSTKGIAGSFFIARNRVPTSGDHGCTCVKWVRGASVMKICNCDRCDGLEINRWINPFCQQLVDDCLLKGFSSGYRTMKGADGLTGIMVEYTMDKTKGADSTPILDPLLESAGVWNVTCRSGNETREWQDESGPLFVCHRTGNAYKACYRINHGYYGNTWMYDLFGH